MVTAKDDLLGVDDSSKTKDILYYMQLSYQWSYSS